MAESAADTPPLPLAGVRVLDVSQVMAGPFCSMLLGDMGADVIKIEPPDGGDQTRRAMGFKLKGTDSLGFFNLNRNKRSLALNLKNKAAREVFYRWLRPRTCWSRITAPASPSGWASIIRP
jgi:formyl-CoA transferase